jgi:hypothetical protein
MAMASPSLFLRHRLDALAIAALIAACAASSSSLPALGRPMSIENCLCGTLNAIVGCRPRTDADAHGGPAFPGCSSAPTCASVLDQRDDALRPVVIPESDDQLVDPTSLRTWTPSRFRSSAISCACWQLRLTSSDKPERTSDLSADQILHLQDTELRALLAALLRSQNQNIYRPR